MDSATFDAVRNNAERNSIILRLLGRQASQVALGNGIQAPTGWMGVVYGCRMLRSG